MPLGGYEACAGNMSRLMLQSKVCFKPQIELRSHALLLEGMACELRSIVVDKSLERARVAALSKI